MGASESRFFHKAYVAITQGREDKLSRLLKKYRGAVLTGINFRDNHGKTLLNYAVSLGRSAMIQTLIMHNADVNIADDEGRTPLHSAVMLGDTATVQQLLGRQANVNSSARDGQTPLQTAIINEDRLMVELLLDHGANVNAQDKHGTTALHLACQSGNEDLVTYLLTRNADVSLRDDRFATPLMKAKAEGFSNLVVILEEQFYKMYKIDRYPPVVSSHDGEAADSSSLVEGGKRLDGAGPTKCDGEDRNCKICWERAVDSVLLWCGHVAVCLACTQYLETCPICCQPIARVQKIFFA